MTTVDTAIIEASVADIVAARKLISEATIRLLTIGENIPTAEIVFDLQKIIFGLAEKRFLLAEQHTWENEGGQ